MASPSGSTMKYPPYTLSVTIITLNEADRIERCLESVKDIADEIIVLDSGSTDGTLDIVRRYTDQVFETDWPGYGPQKQRALEKAQHDWVLAIDADEALDEELRDSVRTLLRQPRGNKVAVKMRWGVSVYGKRLDHGRSARAPLRMVWREGASFTDAQVHEKIVHAPGETVTLKGRLLHYTTRDYGHDLEKKGKYAWLGSQEYFAKGKRCHTLLSPVLRGFWTFMTSYFFRGGFLDGPVGFLVAISYGQRTYNKYAGLWTLTRMEKLERRGQSKTNQQ